MQQDDQPMIPGSPLFAGQTGSGKTYTMLGDSSRLTSASEEGPAGLIPRMCFGLFQKFGLSDSRGDPGGATNNWQASIQVSFCEVALLCCFARTLGDIWSSISHSLSLPMLAVQRVPNTVVNGMHERLCQIAERPACGH